MTKNENQGDAVDYITTIKQALFRAQAREQECLQAMMLAQECLRCLSFKDSMTTNALTALHKAIDRLQP